MILLWQVLAAIVALCLLAAGFIPPGSHTYVVGGFLLFALIFVHEELVGIRQALEQPAEKKKPREVPAPYLPPFEEAARRKP